MPNIGVLKQSSNRRRQSFVAAVAALKRVYPLAGTFTDLRPPQRWQLACRFRKTCSRAGGAGAGAAEICRALADPAGWERTVELLSLVGAEMATMPDIQPDEPIHTADTAIARAELQVDPYLDIAAIRRAIYGDLVEKVIFAKATNRSLRTIDRLIARGLPVVRTPEGDQISPAMAHDWLMPRVKSRDRSARGRGRPLTDTTRSQMPRAKRARGEVR